MLPAMPVRFVLTLLGGFELSAGGQPQALPSRRAAAMLACLAVDGPIGRAALAERLWSGVDAVAARRNLRRELARLKDAGLGDLVAAEAERLALDPTVVETDLAHFTTAGERDDGAAALDSWSGELLRDFVLAGAPEFDDWLLSRRSALTLRWRQCAAAHAERLERDGALREALAWHDRLRHEDPLAERHHAEAMRLHHRLGERGKAIEVYEQCMLALREGADASPAPSTIALAQRIRAAEALQPLVGHAMRPLPPALDPPLIGRDAQARALATSAAAMLLVTGDPGVGKTRLVNDVLRAPSTLALRCEPKARHSALYPLAEALRGALLSPQRSARVAALPMAVRREAARLVPALATLGAEPPRDDGEPVHRERFFDALADVVDAAAGPAGVLWVDDLQWADDATLELLARIANRRVAGCAVHVRIVAAARAPDFEVDEITGPRLRRLERARLLERLPLLPLAESQTLELVRQLSGTQAGELFAARLQRATAGNPYHLLETLRFLFEADELQIERDGTWVTHYDDATADYAELPVPPTLAATVIERTEQLDPAARRVVEAAALTRSGFTLAQIQPATALDEWRAIDGLEAALRLRLFIEAGAGHGAAPSYRFAHDVARESLARALRPERRALIHERLAQALMAQGGAADHIAWHLEESGAAGSAVPWRLEAAREGRRLYAWRAVLEHLGRAYAAAGDAEQRAAIIDERWDAARSLYALDAMASAVADLAQLAAAERRDAWRMQAMVYGAELALLRKRPLPAIEPLREALDQGEFERHGATLRPRAVLALVSAMHGAGQLDAAARVLATIDIDDPAIDDVWRAGLITAAGNAARLGRDAPRALPLLQRAIELYRVAGRLEGRLHAQNMLAHVQFILGDAALATATLEATLEEALRAQLTVVLLNVLPNLSALCAATQQLDRAEAFLERGGQALRGIDHAATQAMLATHLAELRLARGDLGGVIHAAREAVRLYEINGGGSQNYAPWMALAVVQNVCGDYAGAEQVFEALAESPARASGPGVGALVRLKLLVQRLHVATPADALMLASEFEALREPPDAAYARAEADYWRAQALARAGRAGEARALIDALRIDGHEIGLYLNADAVLALRLSCTAAEGSIPAALIEDARRALERASPLAALALASALWIACRTPEAPVGAEEARRSLATKVDGLVASLGAFPELAQGLRRRWAPEGG